MVKRGEIYYADLSPVVGCEQGGCRPVVVLQNNKGNRHSTTTIVAPLTTKLRKSKLPTHVVVKKTKWCLKSTVCLEQIRTIDTSRVTKKLGVVDSDVMDAINYALKVSLEL